MDNTKCIRLLNGFGQLTTEEKKKYNSNYLRWCNFLNDFRHVCVASISMKTTKLNKEPSYCRSVHWRDNRLCLNCSDKCGVSFFLAVAISKWTSCTENFLICFRKSLSCCSLLFRCWLLFLLQFSSSSWSNLVRFSQNPHFELLWYLTFSNRFCLLRLLI